ncbi:MAG: hypothetical protein IJZ82_04140 [Lachnospiraceae bacterium]|nr:hypothetical protein [Lachnospiraceae bacterium]
MDYQSQPKKNAFSTAALLMGILSLISLCTIIGPLVFGSLGIIFAVLAHRQNQKMGAETIIGIVTSAIGCGLSVLLLVVSLVAGITMLADPTYREELNKMTEEVYGYSFDELMEETYGYTLDEMLEEMNYE